MNSVLTPLLVVSRLPGPEGLGLNAGNIAELRTQMSFAACLSSFPVVLASFVSHWVWLS